MTRLLKSALFLFAGLVLLILLLWAVQRLRARSTLAAWDPATTPRLGDIGATTTLTILPLYEGETATPDLVGGPGVSYLVQTDRHTLLLDVGFNPDNLDPSPLEHNMARLGVALADAQTIVVSHNHPDHVGSLSWWRQGTFSPGPSQPALGATSVHVPEQLSYPGTRTQLATAPTTLAPGVATLGTLPFANPFPITLLAPTAQEQVLAVNVEGAGIVLITGCGHPGLEQIINRAEHLLDEPVVGIVGGLHYQQAGAADLAPHIQFLAERRPHLVALSPHDSGPAARAAFAEAFPAAYNSLRVGEPLIFSGH